MIEVVFENSIKKSLISYWHKEFYSLKEMDKVQLLSHIEKPLNYSIFDVKWVPISAKFITIGTKTNGKGIIEIYELDSPNVKLVKDIHQDTPLKCCSFNLSSHGDRHLALGDFNGNLKIL